MWEQGTSWMVFGERKVGGSHLWLFRMNQVWGKVKVGISGVSDPCHLRRKTELWIHLFLSLLQSPLRGLGKQIHLQRKPWASGHREENTHNSWARRCDDCPASSFSFPLVQMKCFWIPFRTLSALTRICDQPGPPTESEKDSLFTPHWGPEVAAPLVSLSPCAQSLVCCPGPVYACFSGSLVMVLLLRSSRT